MNAIQNVSIQSATSISRRPPDIEDYIDMLRRYRSWIVGPMFAGLVVAVVVAFLWPDTFVSTAIMRVTPQQVSERLVGTAISTQMAEKLTQMQTEILSRDRLADIIQKPSLDLYKKERGRLPLEDIVQDMRRHIAIVPYGDAGPGQRAAAFQIRFSYIDKYKAQQVVRELVNQFMEQNANLQRATASLTTNFFNDELKSAKEKMDTLDLQITRFKMENPGQLPDQAGANIQALQTERIQLLNIDNNITRAQQDRMMQETQLQVNRENQRYYESRLEEVVAGTGPASVRNDQLIRLADRISQAKSELQVLKKTFGDKYPEIAAREAGIEAMEKERDDLEKSWVAQQSIATPTATGERRQVRPEVERTIQQYRSEEAQIKTGLAAKQADIDNLGRQRLAVEKEIGLYQHRLEQAPMGEQQYAALLRDHNLAKQDYEEMIKRRDASQKMQSLEEHKAGESLDVLEAANLPDSPSEPNRPTWAGTGLLAGLACGIFLAAAKEVKNTSLKNLKDVRAYTNLPVLSSVPLLENGLLVRRKRRLVWLAWSTAIIVGCMIMGVSMYYHMTGV